MSSAGPRTKRPCLPTSKRVLLVNPPVFDYRYEWVKWNQPLDLLLLAGRLKKVHGCDVRLFDFMQPDTNGRVPRRPAEAQLQDGRPVLNRTLNHFGKTTREFEEFLRGLPTHCQWEPDEVWVTSLTSFWWQSIAQLSVVIRAAFADTKLVVYGNYPRFEPDHARRSIAFADEFVPSGELDLRSETPAFELYSVPPAFRALDSNAPHLLELLTLYYREGVRDFVFFNDPLVSDDNQSFVTVLERLAGAGDQFRQLRIHGLCGLHPEAISEDVVCLLRRAGFCQLHMEPFRDGDVFDENGYRRLAEAVKKGGFEGSDPLDRGVSAFMYIGLPDDDLCDLVHRALVLHSLFGNVILKPYSPTPGRTHHLEFQRGLSQDYSPELISPHRLPCRLLSGVSEGDYLELYRLSAFLNYPVRGHTFDFLGQSYLSRTIARSFADKRWVFHDCTS